MLNHFRFMYIVVIVGLLLVAFNLVNAQDVNRIKSMVVNPSTGDTLIVNEGDLNLDEILNLSGEKIYVIKRVVNRDSTIVVYVPKDSIFQYQVEIIDTISIRSNQQFEKTKIGTSEKIISDLMFFPMETETFTSEIPVDSDSYPVDYYAKLIGVDGLAELKTVGTESLPIIIDLRRIFDKKEFCVLPKAEILGEWQTFVVASPRFWTKVVQQNVPD